METVAVMSHTTVAFESPAGGNKLRSGPPARSSVHCRQCGRDRSQYIYEETYK